ncbi:MAG: hypothetical protein EPO42_14625 [Gallionellaceae bacterium]|nr:MAG: hypothetical protein EPO42_14625 [Gallionellaceae bacterium]
MKKLIAAVSLVLCPALAFAGSAGVRFDTRVMQSGTPVASSSVWVPFGQDAVIELPGKVRIVASAQEPAGEQSLVKAKVYGLAGGKWVPKWSPSMKANLSKTPSFEVDLKGTGYHVVVMPRAADQPSSSGS